MTAVPASSMTDDTLQQQFAELRNAVNQALEDCLPAAATAPQRLHQAMRYAVLGGGKRVRPILCYAAGAALKIPEQRLHASACAVELIHTYSLIHDDLPAMDDDDLRRGRPTCHKAFDEATAILAGDALQALAFEVLTQTPDTPPTAITAMVCSLAQASGYAGMVGGQAIDLAATAQTLELNELEHMHRLKTGALIEVSLLLPAIAAGVKDQPVYQQLQAYARHIGLAFQIQDDILDATGDTATLGKTQGSDLALNKPTYYSLLGLDGAKIKLHETHQAALNALQGFGEHAKLLRAIADYIVVRRH